MANAVSAVSNADAGALRDSSRDSIRKDNASSTNGEKIEHSSPHAHAPKSPAERYAALQEALKVDPGPKPWGWAAIQVSLTFFRNLATRIDAISISCHLKFTPVRIDCNDT